MFLVAALAIVAIQSYFMIFYELMWIYWNYFHNQIIYYTKQNYTHNLNLLHVHFGHSNSGWMILDYS